MKVGIIADGRSQIARNWLATLNELGYEVHLFSTFPSEIERNLTSYHLTPIAFSGVRFGSRGKASAPPGGAGAIRLRALLRRSAGVFTFPFAIRRLRAALEQVELDVLHALRIPYEGMLAAGADPVVPLILSVWGNDFTLHARSAPWMAWLTRRAVTRADALHADCRRDIQLAKKWGFGEARPTAVLPGSGGVDRSLFHPGPARLDRLRPELRAQLGNLTPGAPVVINPRGFRAYVRNDSFFRAIPIILEVFPQARFIAPVMQGEIQAIEWIKRLQVEGSVVLLPTLTPAEMAIMYQISQVMVSPSEHDGTPNTFLEGIASGCFPVVGDLESLREWISDGENGLLIDPGDPQELARAVIKALQSPDLRSQAVITNQELIDKRAERSVVRGSVDAFYQHVLEN
jgi:glycosyltransferase involved in cell wall biosynthesis